ERLFFFLLPRPFPELVFLEYSSRDGEVTLQRFLDLWVPISGKHECVENPVRSPSELCGRDVAAVPASIQRRWSSDDDRDANRQVQVPSGVPFPRLSAGY